jgi:taurine dioxygenase
MFDSDVAVRPGEYRHIRVSRVAGALGAMVEGLDLASPMSPQVLAEIKQAFADYIVVFFRDQELTPDRQLEITELFGPVFRVPFIEGGVPDHPDILAIRKEADERNIITFGGNWHSDFSFLEHPPLGTVLYAKEVPPYGGDTLWSNAYLAYETLSHGMKRLIAGLGAIHSGRTYGTNVPKAADTTSRSMKISRGNPEADVELVHPVVRTHPVTGRKALFINPIYTSRFEDMTEEESKPLIGFLYAHATRPEFTCRFRWASGSVAIWDNRCSLHYALNDYDGHRREMYRTTMAGERPV